MSVIKDQVLERLRRVKGPDLEGNIVDLGLVSEILIKDGRVYFSITVPPSAPRELEPLRQAAEKVVAEIAGVTGVTGRADRREAAPGPAAANGAARSGQAPESAQRAARHARARPRRRRRRRARQLPRPAAAPDRSRCPASST